MDKKVIQIASSILYLWSFSASAEEIKISDFYFDSQLKKDINKDAIDGKNHFFEKFEDDKQNNVQLTCYSNCHTDHLNNLKSSHTDYVDCYSDCHNQCHSDCHSNCYTPSCHSDCYSDQPACYTSPPVNTSQPPVMTPPPNPNPEPTCYDKYMTPTGKTGEFRCLLTVTPCVQSNTFNNTPVAHIFYMKLNSTPTQGMTIIFDSSCNPVKIAWSAPSGGISLTGGCMNLNDSWDTFPVKVWLPENHPVYPGIAWIRFEDHEASSCNGASCIIRDMNDIF